ncbi:SEC-C metal-binding domain-containing protein [Paenibacillus alginolyticus]|uniref:SEC-C metal-binding domain-containing protein n=1 Tax=Paenibacillus alginolyticus TaxID=59839 RepID=UPI00040B5501|nr:SEC-C metal-binding domain-containing protein [Paenibacillus alginolyticus]
MKTTDELTIEEQQQYWGNEIALFGKYLAEEGKLKADTIDKHVGRMHFMTTIYFINYEIDYDQLQSETIIDFLGRFYISDVLSSSKSEIGGYLPSIKKWVQFLLQSEKISAKQCTEILQVCKHKEFFMERFEQYMDADYEESLEDWHYSNDIEAYLATQATESAPIKVEMRPIVVDKSLLEQWMDEKTTVPQIVADYQKFLTAVQDTRRLKLTPSRHHLPRKFWKELDERLDLQLFHKLTLNQDNVPLFQFFFYAAQHLGLIAEIKQQCVITHQADGFLALTGEEQAVVLLDTLWNKIGWEMLQETNEGGRPEVTQASRARIAQVLASWPVDEPQDAYSDWMRNKLKGELFNGSTDVFLHSVIPVLERFGLVRAQFKPQSEITHTFERVPIQMAVTDAGIRVFRYFQNQRKSSEVSNVKRRLDPISQLLISMEEDSRPIQIEKRPGRNEPCPCGSGKKFKRCCL